MLTTAMMGKEAKLPPPSCFPQNHCILCKSNANKAANARPDTEVV
jgi:hypothetical protein